MLYLATSFLKMLFQHLHCFWCDHIAFCFKILPWKERRNLDKLEAYTTSLQKTLQCHQNTERLKLQLFI